jgi:hypothetical protein
VCCDVQGHGMTVAALEVAKLDELLAARQAAAAATPSSSERSWLAGLSGEYQQAITPIVQRVWELSVGECHVLAELVTTGCHPAVCQHASLNNARCGSGQCLGKLR